MTYSAKLDAARQALVNNEDECYPITSAEDELRDTLIAAGLTVTHSEVTALIDAA